MCCSRLAERDLEAEPLQDLIRPHGLLGLNLKVKVISETQLTVELARRTGRWAAEGNSCLNELI
jgi:hypothetical protein